MQLLCIISTKTNIHYFILGNMHALLCKFWPRMEKELLEELDVFEQFGVQFV